MQVEQYTVDQKPSRKGKERDPTQRDLPQPLQPTDLDEKLTALRRRTAGVTRPRERPERDRMATTTTVQITQVTQPKSSSQSQTRSERSPKFAALPPANRQSPTSPRRHASPQVIVSRPTLEAEYDDFSRLKISSPSTRPQQSHKAGASSKLFNPNTDPIPLRRTTEPESMSDGTGSSYVHVQRSATGGAGAGHRDDRGNNSRQLFDHRKDDPVRFSVLTRPQPPSTAQGRTAPTPKHSGDYISASSTSSYAPSISSSAFTLSSTTDGSSTSSALFEGRPNQGTEDSGNSVFSVQLKKLYREITNLENKIKQEDSADEPDDGLNTRVLLKGKEAESEDLEKERWKKQITDHKQLAENMHNLLEISLAPSVPVSLRNIPTKYNIIVRLWTYAFHKLLECLRRASFRSPLALEHLQDFIYYAYSFYTGLLEEPTLNPFKSGWVEALGDLARYRMIVAAWVGGGSSGQSGLTTKAVSDAAAAAASATQSVAGDTGIATPGSDDSVSEAPAARIDDSPSPSIGVAAARLLELEPEKERWRNIARDWYGAGLSEQPGNGKLHHHLGLLSREVETEELRGVYHFVKSMTTLHPFSTSRESILSLWSLASQARRSVPDARASDLFVLLHGMLFTNIQLDDFQPSLARLIERLEIEGVEEREWIMMAVINIGSIFEYGRPSSVLRKIGCVGTKEINGTQVVAAMRVMAKKAAASSNTTSIGGGGDEEKMDVDEDQKQDTLMKSPSMTHSDASHENGVEFEVEQPTALRLALQLTFSILSHVLRRPTRKASEYSRSNLNPYLTIILTFLSTILKHKPTLDIMERSIPWNELSDFFATIPRKIMISQGLMPASGKPTPHRSGERWAMLTSGCAPPLPEDWCMRGMEWVGRKVYERGFWKTDDDQKAELAVLETVEAGQLTDGMIEDDDGDDGPQRSSSSGSTDLIKRWVRIARSAVSIAGTVDGLSWKDGTRDWTVEGKLAQKVTRWREEEELARQDDERRRLGRRWGDDAMDVDEGADMSSEDSETDEEDENDSEEIKALKARRKYLKEILQSRGNAFSTSNRLRSSRATKKVAGSRPKLPMVPGYTILVVDTNILLSSLSMVSSLIESLCWTVVIPLPVIMELDGISSNDNQLGHVAQAALTYITSHIRSHSVSLKVQTSRGNYLTSLSVRSEAVDFDGTAERSMDDLILKAAIWQDDHWVDRSAMLKAPPSESETKDAAKVVLLSLDRNLRLKARSRQLSAANEKDLVSFLASAT